MRRAGLGLLTAVLGMGALSPLAGTTSAATPAEPADPPAVVSAAPVELPHPATGREALRLLDDQVGVAAALNGLRTGELRAILRSDDTAWLSTSGRVFYREPIVSARAAASTPAAAYPLEQTFLLHSKPGAQRTIFIDVDGAQVGGTEWHAQYPTTPTTHPAWDPGANGPAFDDAEKAAVQEVWQRVAEDYAPFDVDVTTQDPGAAAIRRSSVADQQYGAHALVSPSDAFVTICDSRCGGIAYLNVFDEVTDPADSGYGRFQPAWVFPQGTTNDPKTVAEALSHEVGHQLGLSHDGNAAEEYDDGHDGWAPVMGVGYVEPISQWSQGDYATANNQEDDVAIIAGTLGERVDEAPPSTAGAPPVPTGTAYVSYRDDVDVYRLGACTGPVSVTAAPTLTSGANLDLRLSVLDASGSVVATDDPPSVRVSATTATGLGATISLPTPSGRTYLAVEGVGRDGWPSGYDDYGSLGAYSVQVTGSCDGQTAPGVPAAPVGLVVDDRTNTSVSLSWSAPSDPGTSTVTGYVLTRTGSAQTVQVGADATTYTWNGLRAGTPYTFSVTAVNASGPGSTGQTSGTTMTAVPSAPRNLRATWDASEGGLLVAWNRPESDGGSQITGYDFWVDDFFLGTLEGPGTGAILTDLPPDSYTVDVAARNALGAGAKARVEAVVPATAPNDSFGSRDELSGVSGQVDGDNAGASAEEDDPVPPGLPAAGGASVWYSWTAPASGPVTLHTSSAIQDRDTTLAAYTGSSLGALTRVAGNDDIAETDYLSRITFTATVGTTYAIAVDGYRNLAAGTGPFTLHWAGTAPSTPTTTTLSATPSGRQVTLRAEVTAVGTPAGTVQFHDGVSVVATRALVDGVATAVLAPVPTGTHTYVATFVPADLANFMASTSSPAQATLAASSTTTTLWIDKPPGQATLNVSVTSPDGTPHGSVAFYDGPTSGTPLGRVQVVGSSNYLILMEVTPGPHTYTAVFEPYDDMWLASASAPQTVTIEAPEPDPVVTTTELDVQVTGRRVTLTTTVEAEAGVPVGAVQLTQDGVVVDTVPVTDGTATSVRSLVAAGTRRYAATFVPSDAADFATSTSPTATVSVAATPTTTSLEATASGGSLTLAATVTAAEGAPQGAVEMREGTALLGTVAVVDGRAVLMLAGVAPGSRRYQATFVPAGTDFLGSTSTVATATFAAPVVASRTTLTAPRTATAGTRPKVTVKVLRGTAAATGRVVLRVGKKKVALQLRGGSASYRLPKVKAGRLRIIATYAGDATTTGSSATATIRVRKKR